MAAAQELRAISRAYPLASGPPETMKLVAPGRAQVVCRQATLKGLDSNGVWQVYGWEELSVELGKAKMPLQHVREALRQPSLDLDLDYSQGLSLTLPHLNEARNVARWLDSAALDNIHNGNLDEAVTNIASIVQVARFLKNERLDICQLVRMAIGEIGLTMTWEALQSPGWSDAQLARLSEVWRTEHTVSDMVHAAEMERALTLVHFDTLRRDRSVRRDWMKGTFDVNWEYDRWVHDGSHELPGKIRLFFASELWGLLWSYQDEYRAVHGWQRFLDTARTVEKRESWVPVSLPPTMNDHGGGSLRSARFHFSNMLAGPGLEGALLRVLFFETHREMTCSAIAIKRYQLRTGKPPSDLAALVPEYLSEIPHDWMDGKQLRYRLNADGTFTLYSVGEDGHDDGGDPSFRPDRWGKYLLYCRDMVWPSPLAD